VEEKPSLLGPTHGDVVLQLFQSQVMGLAPIKNCLNDVWSEESISKDMAHVSLIQSQLLRNGSRAGCFSANHLLVPIVRAEAGGLAGMLSP
jgi:hypothetical protein